MLQFGNPNAEAKIEIAHRITMRVLKAKKIKAQNLDFSYTASAIVMRANLIDNNTLFELRELNLSQVMATI